MNLNYCHRLALIAASVFALFATLPAAADDGLPVASEQKFLDSVMLPTVENQAKWVVRGKRRVFTYQKKNVVVGVEVSEETGRVVSLEGNAPPITNETLRQMAKELPELAKIALGHWGNWGYKQFTPKDFNGAGFDAFANSKLKVLAANGSHFSDEGAAAAAKIKGLKSYTETHTAAHYATSLASVATNPSIEELHVSSSFNDHFTNAQLPLVLAFPNLKSLTIGESFFTWDGGLDHLAGMKDRLKTLRFSHCAIFPEDLAKLRAALPGTEVTMAPELSDPKNWVSSYADALPRFKKWLSPEDYARLESLLPKAAKAK